MIYTGLLARGCARLKRDRWLVLARATSTADHWVHFGPPIYGNLHMYAGFRCRDAEYLPYPWQTYRVLELFLLDVVGTHRAALKEDIVRTCQTIQHNVARPTLLDMRSCLVKAYV